MTLSDSCLEAMVNKNKRLELPVFTKSVVVQAEKGVKYRIVLVQVDAENDTARRAQAHGECYSCIR
jgi:hypothetical protein